MHVKLVDYFYGGLDPEEMLYVEQMIASDEQTQRLLGKVQEAFAPLEGDRQHVDAPHGLARRTCLGLWIHQSD